MVSTRGLLSPFGYGILRKDVWKYSYSKFLLCTNIHLGFKFIRIKKNVIWIKISLNHLMWRFHCYDLVYSNPRITWKNDQYIKFSNILKINQLNKNYLSYKSKWMLLKKDYISNLTFSYLSKFNSNPVNLLFKKL